MSDEEAEERMALLSYLKIHPREHEENRLLLFRCERLYEESTGNQRQQAEIHLRRFEDALDSRDRAKIEKARKEIKEFLKGLS